MLDTVRSRFRIRWLIPVAILGLAAGLIGAFASSSAHHEGDLAVHACVSYYTGAVRIPHTGVCSQTERQVDLAQAGGPFDVTVINEADDPVPVVGNVEVSNDEGNPLPVQSQQSGNWNVTVDGGQVTTETGLATEFYWNSFVTTPFLGGPREKDLDLGQTINVSFISIATSDDDYMVSFYEDDTLRLRIGNDSSESPNLVNIPLTQRIPINRIVTRCGNDVHPCEFDLSVAGD